MTTFDRLSSFRASVVDAVVEAAASEARSLIMVDPDFADWPLEDPTLIEALTTFARRPGRRVWLLARHYDGVRLGCPRFTTWRTTFGHAVEARVPEAEQAELPSLLIVDRTRAVRVDDRRHWLGAVVEAAPEVHALRQHADALLQRGGPGFASTTLGL